MDYEDYMPEDFDSEYIGFDSTSDEPWDNEWDSFGDWVYEGEYTDNYDDYWN